MEGYWQREGEDEEIRNRDDVEEVVREMIDNCDDNGEFCDYVNDHSDEVIDDFTDREGDCKCLYERMKDDFVERTVDDMMCEEGDDYTLFGEDFIWHCDVNLTVIEVEIHTTIVFNPEEKTQEDAIEAAFPNAKNHSIIVKNKRTMTQQEYDDEQAKIQAQIANAKRLAAEKAEAEKAANANDAVNMPIQSQSQ